MESLEDHLEPDDTPAEVAAAFRTQRRVAVAYLLLFLAITVSIPVLNALVDWWTDGRLLGGISPAFAVSTVGLYGVIITIGVLGARVADQVERRMLGGRELLDEQLHIEDGAGP
ncbi:MAG TPA: hypothetical protein VMM13_20150 [Euzebya sp.]|nr:hypothetical protein [Euzebya sp.]